MKAEITNPYFRPNDTAESRLAETAFLVEATGMERLTLWSRHAKDSPERIDSTPVEWHQVSPGWAVTVGELSGSPVTIEMDWCELNGSLVCFYHDISMLVDHKQIDDWIDKNFAGTWGGGRRAVTDAMNFHHCLQAIECANANASATK